MQYYIGIEGEVNKKKGRKMKDIVKILIGGQALRKLGSDRHTDDIDYLVNNENSKETFICSESVDFINANGNKFFAEIFKIEKGNQVATPQSLLELKAYAFVQHCQNFNFRKADACEYDIKFLVRKFNLKEVKIVNNHLAKGELFEVDKIIKSVKKEN